MSTSVASAGDERLGALGGSADAGVQMWIKLTAPQVLGAEPGTTIDGAVLVRLAETADAALRFLARPGRSDPATVRALVLAAVAGAVSAVGAVATAEQFAGEGRVTGLALGATTATAIFGGLTPWLAQLLIERTDWTMAPGALIALVALCVVPIFLKMRETAPLSARPSQSTSS